MPRKHKNTKKTTRKRGAKPWARANRKIRLHDPFRATRVFPNIYRCKMTIQIEDSVASSAVGLSLVKGNSVINVGPANAWGTALSAYAANVPTNLYQLLSSSSAAGASGVYGRFRVIGSRIKTQVMSTTLNSTVPYYLVIWPTNDLTFAGMSITNIREQPRAVSKLVTSTDTSGDPTVVMNTASTMSVYGLRYRSLLEAAEYSGTALTDPTFSWIWAVSVQGFNGVAVSVYLTHTIEYDVEFFDYNQETSTAPT